MSALRFEWWTVVVLSLATNLPRGTGAQDDVSSAADRISRATRQISQNQTFQLRYKLQQGQSVRWIVEHIASTKTSINSQSEESSSRSRSVKLWKVVSVDARGNMTFQHIIESVSMWQKVGDRDPVTFDSATDQEPPIEYEHVASSIGNTLATITLDPLGTVIDRKTDLGPSSFGVGDIAIPLPEEAISIGHQWSVAGQHSARHADGRVKQIKTRLLYELEDVQDNIATISFRTEVLTPIDDPKIKSQLIQQLSRGKITFDMAEGLPVSKEVDWDERIQGFEGPDSYLEYLGRFTEQLQLQRSAGRDAANGTAPQQLRIRLNDDPPALRK